MSETMTVDELKQDIEGKKKELRRLKLVEYQREHLLPRLDERSRKLHARIEELGQDYEVVNTAIDDINRGEPTDYRLRAKPKKRMKEPVE